MDPIIFRIPESDTLSINDIQYSDTPSPKLIKYGFTNTENDMDFVAMTENANYQNGLLVNEENLKKEFPGMTPVSLKINEIIKLFDIPVTNSYVGNIAISGIKDTKSKTYDLVIQNYSDALVNETDENSSLLLLMKDVSNLLALQKKGSSMILQMSDTKTLPTVQLIQYLSSLYTDSYLVKPISSSEISSERYLVLLNMTKTGNFPEIKTDRYVIRLSSSTVPDNINTTIQCFNSRMMKLKVIVYDKIKKYLEEQVYLGSMYQNMMKTREEFNKKLKERLNKNQEGYLDSLVKKSQIECQTLNPDY